MKITINKRWQIVLFVSLFNLLAEYSLRGINDLVRMPGLAILVFLNYLPYFAIVEDFIGRFKLKDYHVWILAFSFTALWQLVSVAAIYFPPLVFGINPGVFFINNIIWWPTLQTVFGFYIARRIAGKIDRSLPFLSIPGIVFCFVAFVLVSSSFHLFVPKFPRVMPQQYFITLILIIAPAFLFMRLIRTNLKKAIVPETASDKFLDVIAVFTIVYLIFSFFYFTREPGVQQVTPLNRDALRLNVVVTPIIALLLLIRRLQMKRPISI